MRKRIPRIMRPVGVAAQVVVMVLCIRGAARKYADGNAVGLTVAPALGELVAGEILDERRADALDRFRPARFERVMT